MFVGVARVVKIRLIEVQGNPGTPPRTLSRRAPAGFALNDALLRTPKGSTILIRETSMAAA